PARPEPNVPARPAHTRARAPDRTGGADRGDRRHRAPTDAPNARESPAPHRPPHHWQAGGRASGAGGGLPPRPAAPTPQARPPARAGPAALRLAARSPRRGPLARRWTTSLQAYPPAHPAERRHVRLR